MTDFPAAPPGLDFLEVRKLARLGVDEITAIEAIAKSMAQNLENDLPALSYKGGGERMVKIVR